MERPPRRASGGLMRGGEITVQGKIEPEYKELLSDDALNFLASLEREFGDTRRSLLQKRIERANQINAGATVDFPSSTGRIRENKSWRVASIPPDLQNRRVEITGPTDRKMMINAFNSGANVFMADFEDANSPTWKNMLEGHINLRDAIERTISF